MRNSKGQFVKGDVPKTAFKKGCIGVNKGRKFTPEHRAKLSAAKKGRSVAYLSGPKREDILKKIGDSHRGEKSRNWKGGVTHIYSTIRSSAAYRLWRTSVFQRDQFTCQTCGDSQGGNLQADHIKPFSTILTERHIKTIEEALKCNELWDIANGRTLCIPCHEKTPTYGSKQTWANKKIYG